MDRFTELFAVMDQLTHLRRRVVAEGTRGPAAELELTELRSCLDRIRNIAASSAPTANFSYEISELAKDIRYLSRGDRGLELLMDEARPATCTSARMLATSIAESAERHGGEITLFVTDRDGTINNYSARYRSSGQSIYNATYLVRFSEVVRGRSVILSSGPLFDGGLVDLSVAPAGVFVYAGSKGREYLDERGKRGALPIPADQQTILELLNRELSALLRKEEYRKFGLIGSAVQHKFGQTTVARQDMDLSVPPAESAAFLGTVTGIVERIDPRRTHLRIEDTGTDIEITLTRSESVSDATRPAHRYDRTAPAVSEFDKAAGVRFLDSALDLRLESGFVLVCGDTRSDIPMATEITRRNQNTCVVFVTEDADLRNQVRSLWPKALFARTPDELVLALRDLSS